MYQSFKEEYTIAENASRSSFEEIPYFIYLL